ncbi:MAG: TonB-dependent receptor plug domain-containing protein [Alphaproteobacteria bacterium]|nr:TonB-dependent receptor plug domain-containing protein [Alphaproteobacteria bacterium]
MTKQNLKRLRMSVGLTALALAIGALSGPAMAQAAGDDTKVDTIIVTAQQREENLQDVPVSVATVPKDLLNSMFADGSDVLALSARVPGVYAESSNGRVAPRFYIRGLGNIDFDLAASQPVSIIMDDVVQENVVLKSFPLFDQDQVEVYRGPQGSLFGRNTTAGIIRFKSVRPSDTFSADGSASYGSFNTVNLEGGVGGPLVAGVLSARASMLYQHRDDWIDNTTVPGDKNLGGYDERAARFQLLYTPTDRLNVLLNVHGRDLDGTSAIFRANVITTGTNGLNSNYDRDRVSYDQGGGNPQKYKGWGTSANVGYDFGPVKLTSITGYEETHGFSRGDIDGGVAGVGPGFIPFDSDTQDGLDSLNQFTEEVRLASTSAGPLTWQTGAFYFHTDYVDTTVGPTGFPPSTSVRQKNDSWAIFGQGSYAFTDQFSVTAGLRYTNDDKDLIVASAPSNNRSVSDDKVSWDLSAMYKFTPAVSVYARVADGFRGPSIQGRNIAFGSPPSVAQSETNLSFEAGWKTELLNDTLRFNGAVFQYTVDHIQLTAVGGAGNLVQLINANKGKAYGFETDIEYVPMPNLIFTGGFSYNHTKIDDPGLLVGICAQCTITDPTVMSGATTYANIDGNPFPNAPETTADFTARYSIPMGAGGELFAFTDWSYQGKTNIFLYESVEFHTDHQFEGGLKLGYARTNGLWEAAVFVRNITDEDNIKGAIDFNNNTAFVNDPRVIGVSLNVKY